jgi:hypothetical protein
VRDQKETLKIQGGKKVHFSDFARRGIFASSKNDPFRGNFMHGIDFPNPENASYCA